jgi:hypothetical protein
MRVSFTLLCATLLVWTRFATSSDVANQLRRVSEKDSSVQSSFDNFEVAVEGDKKSLRMLKSKGKSKSKLRAKETKRKSSKPTAAPSSRPSSAPTTASPT